MDNSYFRMVDFRALEKKSRDCKTTSNGERKPWFYKRFTYRFDDVRQYGKEKDNDYNGYGVIAGSYVPKYRLR